MNAVRNTHLALVAVIAVLAAGQASALPDNGTDNGCPVVGYSFMTCPVVNDNVIRHAVTMRLAGSVSSPCYPVSVYVTDGAVTLVGQVESSGKIDLASILASGIRGVACINNQLCIVPAAAEEMQLVAAVRNQLRKQPFTSRQIGIQAAEGVVELTGTVGSDWDRDQAGQIAAGVPGVTAVHNNIGVSGPGTTNW